MTSEPDAPPRFLPLPGESVLFITSGAIVDRFGHADSVETPGTIILTDRRVVHLGRVATATGIDDIVEAGLAGERLILDAGGGRAMVLAVPNPGLLRRHLAILRAGAAPLPDGVASPAAADAPAAAPADAPA